jgi:hypothetical protein
LVTVYRSQGLKAVIFVDDHEPAHGNMFGDGQANINLLGKVGKPELAWVDGMKRGEVRRAMQIVIERQAELLTRWREIHG